MKLLNGKGKLFGIINLIDLLVVLALLGAAAALFVTFALPSSDASPQTENIVYTVRVRGVFNRVRAFIDKGLASSSQLMGPEGLIDDARVLSYYYEPYTQLSPTRDGRLIEIELSERCDVVFTLEATIPSGAAPIMVDTQPIRIGINHTVRTPSFEFLGSIESLSLEGDAS